MNDDQQLLRRFATDHSEDAFAELVARHINLVYSAALRRVGGDSHLAQDISQLVFADLARKAHALQEDIVLAGWLHRATHYAAAQVMRAHHRRRRREQDAIAMNALESQTSTDWDSLRPVLDEVLDKLNQTDRDALVLRFFEQRNLADVGRALGSNEDAARKRVNRALEKLRSHLSRRGLTTTAATLSAAISVNAVQIAPAGLAATLTSVSLAGVGTAAGLTPTILKLMSLTKLQLTVGAVALTALTASLVIQNQSQHTLRKENESLWRRVAQLSLDNKALSEHFSRTKAAAPRLPAPAIQSPNSSAGPALDALQSTNLYDRLKDKNLKLTAAQLETYLKTNGRNASSLLAAYRTSGDPKLLTEAMQKYPNDSQVAFEAALRKDASPEERRPWLDVLKKSDPDNALPNYLSALDDFKTGQTDAAIKEFMAASNKQFQDYTSERYQDDAEAYMAAGYSVADAKAASGLQLLLPQLQQVKDLGLNLVELSKSYQQADDPASAQAALQMAVSLGGRYANPSPGEPAISQLVGQTLEIIALKSMDPNSSYDSSGQTVQDRINQILQQKTALEDRSHKVESIVQNMPEQDWVTYRDRWLIFGEQNAEQWLIDKYNRN